MCRRCIISRLTDTSTARGCRWVVWSDLVGQSAQNTHKNTPTKVSLASSDMISEEEGTQCGFGRHAVTEIENHFVRLKDSTRLAIKLWFPQVDFSATTFHAEKSTLLYSPADVDVGRTYPAVLEYLPYRRDYTAMRDHKRHTWFASHGYVVVRCDFRGTGDSDGLYYDEYLPQEQKDGCEVISWLAAQDWCNGAVGMYGKSWGGFNGLQIAYEQPPALKAVVSLYSTDDRYMTDMHHDGGCIIAHGLLSWASYMFCFNARTPDPRHRPDWKQVWRERLEKTAYPWANIWAAHQLKDDYWLHGSVNTEPARVKCPVLAIGGWRDGYTDAVFRLVRDLPQCRGIVGPWSHEWPDEAKPGPHMDYLRECLAWWDCHLKGIQNNAMDQPKIRLYVADSMEPSRQCTFMPGKWISFNQWPSDANTALQTLYPGPGNSLQRTQPEGGISFSIPFDVRCGKNGPGAWLSFGMADNADDQTPDDRLSATFTTQPLNNNLSIVGFPWLLLGISINNHDGGVVIARLCDVSPDDRSTLVTYGVLNLTHADGHTRDKVKPLEPGKVFNLRLELHATGYTVPPGHRLRLALSSSWWPCVWPSSKPVPMNVHHAKLSIPLYTGSESRKELICPQPALGPPIPHKLLEPDSFSIDNTGSGGEHTRRIKCNFGRILLTDQQILFNHRYEENYSTREHDPLSARATCEHAFELGWPNYEGAGLQTMVTTRSVMRANVQEFMLDHKLHVELNGEKFFEQEWSDKVKREFM